MDTKQFEAQFEKKPADYEKITIQDVGTLKQPTIYFFLKTSHFSEHFIKNLRNTPNSIILNFKAANTRKILQPGDILYVLKNPNPPTRILACPGKLDILYEDEDFLIVDKPHNLSCTPSRSHFADNLGGQICNYMWQKDPNFVLRIANRLDKETAGIVIVAKSVLARNNIAGIHKEYHALCEGRLEEEFFTIDKPIQTVTNGGINERKRVISPDGKPAVTHVWLLQNLENSARIKLFLETGRTHQIRLHMASIGHPLIGDTIYNPNSNENSCTHLLLKKVKFVHFRTGKTISITSNQTVAP